MAANRRPLYQHMTSRPSVLQNVFLTLADVGSTNQECGRSLLEDSRSAVLSYKEGSKLAPVVQYEASSKVQQAPLLSRVCAIAPFKDVGWRFGLYAGLYSSLLVLCGNIVILLVGCFSHGGFVEGIAILARAKAEDVGKISTAYHVLINLLSTILLVSSNYAMQILCAPTREEVEYAHSVGKWADIGLMSVHNFRFIQPKRILLWIMLAFSSLPLHLFYNSAVFEVESRQEYTVDFVNVTVAENSTHNGWTKMDNKDWQQAYGNTYDVRHGNLHLVVSAISYALTINSNWTLQFVGASGTICNRESWNPTFHQDDTSRIAMDARFDKASGLLVQPATLAMAVANISDDTDWSVFPSIKWPDTLFSKDWTGDLVTDALQLCEGSPGFPITHCVLRMGWQSPVSIRTVAIFLTLRSCASTNRLITVGDAVASFLENPERRTLGKCALQKSSITIPSDGEPERAWQDHRHHLTSIVGGKRWGSNIIVLMAIVADIAALTYVFAGDTTPGANNNHTIEPSSAYNKWGTASKLTLPFTPSSFDNRGILLNAWISNVPQVILSFLYFGINRLCTSMCYATEWNNYALQRKSLRVTDPSSYQRPTRFLQLPYRWAVPLAVASGLLHWLLSQSLFLVRVEYRDKDGILYPRSTCSTGYSPLSFLVFTFVFLALLIVVAKMMLRTMNIAMPISNHCSLVISAACHPPPDDVDTHLKKVQWGVVRNRFGGTIDHCTFTSEEVSPPTEGVVYA